MKLSQNITFTKILKASTLSACMFALVLGGFSVASAQDDTAQNPTTPRKDFKDARGAIRAIATSTRGTILQDTKTEIKDLRASNTAGARASTSVAIGALRVGLQADLIANRASTTEAIKAKRAELLKEIAARKGDKKKKLAAQALATVQKALGNVYANLSDKITRLNKVNVALTAKLNQLGNNGTDVTSASALLATAQASLSKATIDVQVTGSLAREQTATTTSKEILKGLITTARTSVRTAGQDYKKVADSIKAYLPSTEASSTTSISASSSVNSANI